MPKFLKLTSKIDGDDFYLNFDFAAEIFCERNKNFTTVRMHDYGEYEVTQSPGQILKMLEEKCK